MTLAELFALERGAQSRLSAETGIPAPMLSQWASGARPIPIDRCVAIETGTGKKVMRWDLRPNDWREIWPELARAKGAPAAPSDSAQHGSARRGDGPTSPHKEKR